MGNSEVKPDNKPNLNFVSAEAKDGVTLVLANGTITMTVSGGNTDLTFANGDKVCVQSRMVVAGRFDIDEVLTVFFNAEEKFRTVV